MHSIFILNNCAVTVAGYTGIACNGICQAALGTFDNARISTCYSSLGIHIILICQKACQISGAEGNHFFVIKRLDAFHKGIVAAIYRNALKGHGAFTFAVIDNGSRNNLIIGFINTVAGTLIAAAGTNLGVKQPERYIHRLDILHTIVGRKGVRQQSSSLVEFLKGSNSLLFGFLEGDDEVRLQHTFEAARQHGRAAAVAAFCCHGVAVAHNLRTAAGAGERLHLLCFVSFPFAAGSRGIPLSLLGSLRFSSSGFLGGIHFFYSLNFQLGTAVFAGHLIMTWQKRKRRAAVRALIAYRGFSHNITSLKYSYAILIAPAPPLVAYFDILPSTHER